MSLLHWWPLNGNLNNKGISNVSLTNNGATINSSGKIGSCYYFNSAILNSSALDLSSCSTGCSLAIWAKIPTSQSAWSQIFILGTSGTSWNNIRVGIDINSSGIPYFNISNGSSNTNINSDTAIKDGIWHHICGTYDGTNLNLYIDGVLVKTGTTSYVPALSSAYIYIGGNAAGEKLIAGYLNDARIYDHALSAKEVKEISKGLVLHYNFEDEYIEPTTNLVTSITAGGQTTVSNGIVTTSGTSADTYFTLNMSESLTANTIYSISCDAEIPEGSWSFPIGGQGNTALTFVIYNGHNEYTFTMNSFSAGTNRCFMDDVSRNAAANHQCKMWNWQIEKKDHATPYVNGTRSAGKVYDNSGYGNNGTNNGVILSDDSISGKFSGYFESNKYISFSSPFGGSAVSECTISFWCKLASSTSYQFIFGALNNPASGAGWIALNTESYGQWFYTGQYIKCWSNTIANNEWHLHTLTFKNGIGKWYLDGWCTGTVDISANRTSLSGASTYSIGDSYTGSSWSGTPFNGYIADFKIYSTALSAEDILAEYNRKAAIDKNGNLFTGEFIEYQTSENLLELANYKGATQQSFDGYLAGSTAKKSYYDANFPNKNSAGLGAYTQGNLQVTNTAQGIRIYSAPNRDGRAQEGSEWNTWGGLCLSPMKNSNCLIKGHRYVLSWHMKGQSSRALNSVYWSNQIGWGQSPDASPTENSSKYHPANFNGEMDCYYDFTINDDVFKTTGSTVHSGFEANTTYLAYAAFKIGYEYGQTGELGTDIYITHIKLIDITDNKVYKIDKNNFILTTDLDAGTTDIAKIHRDGGVRVNDIYEL